MERVHARHYKGLFSQFIEIKVFPILQNQNIASTHNNNFDLIRLFAASQVALAHTTSHLNIEIPWLLAILSYIPGVPIFFVVSGFLVSASFDRRTSLRGYFANRFLRIYPALWACLLVSIVVILALYRPEHMPSPLVALSWIVAQVSIGQFYTPDFLRGYGLGNPNGSLWTIPVELQFYLVLPLVALWLARLKRGGIILCGAIIVFAVINQLYAFAVSQSPEHFAVKLLGVTVFPYLYLFMLGMLINMYKEKIMPLVAGKLIYWLTAFGAVTFLLNVYGIQVFGNLLNPISATLLGITVISAAYTSPNLASNILRGNDISYGLYIYHAIFLNAAIYLGLQGDYSVFSGVLAASVVFATASWHLIERPALRTKKRFAGEPVQKPTSNVINRA